MIIRSRTDAVKESGSISALPHFKHGNDLFGRGQQIKILSECLNNFSSADAGSHVVEVIGEPGIGKSALLARFATMAQHKNLPVRTGNAASGGQNTPLAAFANTFEDSTQRASRGRTSPGARREVASGNSPGHPGELPADWRERLDGDRHVVVRDMLERLGSDKIVLVLDDLHNADQSSLHLIANLLRQPPRLSVMFVFGYRARQAPATLRLAINDGSPRLPVTRLWLPPLSEQDVDSMLADSGPASWRANLYHRSRGNPAYLLALVAEQTAVSQGVQPDNGDTRSFEYTLFQAELAALAPGVRAVAEAAATAGEEFDAGLLARMLGQAEPDVLHAIGELIRYDIVRPVEHGPYYAFRHPVVRRAIYHGIELVRRIELHGQADSVLRARGAAAIERADHVEQCAKHGDLDAVDVLDAAAATIDAERPGRTVSWLASALRLLPQQPDQQPRRARLLVRLARAQGMVGRLQECRDLMHEALREMSADCGEERAEAVAFTAMVQRLLGAYAETNAMLRAEIARVDSASPASAALRFELAAGQVKTGESVECCVWAQEALAIARRHQDRPLQASCLALLAKANISSGHIAASTRHLAQASVMLDAMFDHEFARSLDSVEWVAWAEIMLNRWNDAERHLEKAVDFAVRADLRLTLPRLLLAHVLTLRTRGRLAEACAAAEYALELAEHSGGSEQLFAAQAMLLWTTTIHGRHDGRLSGLLSGGQPKDVVSSWRDTVALRMLAEARMAVGNHEDCLALVDIVGGPKLPACSGYSRVPWYELCTRAELAANRLDEAARWAELAADTAATVGEPGRIGLALLARAQVDLARGADSAVTSARQAAERLDQAGLTIDALRARQVLGVALAGTDWDEAVRQVKAVELAFEQMGAGTLARNARNERRKLAMRHGPRAKDAADTETINVLTARERQVADLVRDGLTNRLIAKALYISEKTVEMHLSRVFAKLRVPSRAALAAFISEGRAATASL